MIPDLAAFSAVCHTLHQHPKCTDKGFKGALEDFPKSVANYGRLTEKQYKFFSFMHKTIMGTWPKRQEAVAEKKEPQPFSKEELPF